MENRKKGIRTIVGGDFNTRTGELGERQEREEEGRN